MIEFSSEIMVEYEDSMGDDLRIVNAARASKGVKKFEFDSGDAGLIKSLIRDEHGAPFEKVRFEFYVECPIWMARQWFKHRFSSFSELSGRYTEIVPKFWLPTIEGVRMQVGKAMSYEYVSLDEVISKDYVAALMDMNIKDYEFYRGAIEHGIAKEVSRYHMPLNMYTKFMWGTDLRNLVNFLVLRNDKHAQREIQEAAQKVEDTFKDVCPHTYNAWIELGRPRLAGID
jgi:thymidylate synthase (FAD)